MGKKIKNIINNSLGLATKQIVSFLGDLSKSKQKEAAHTIAALVKTLMSPNEDVSANDIESFRVIWNRYFQVDDTDLISGLLDSVDMIAIEELREHFAIIPQENYSQIFSALMEIAANSKDSQYAFGYLKEATEIFDIDPKNFEDLKEQSVERAEKRQKLMRSGAGLLVALAVIAIFVLTATLLKSVIFGLLLAFLMLPSERYFEKKLADPKSLLGGFFGCYDWFIGLFKKKSKIKLTKKEIEKKQQLLLIRRAVSLSCCTLVIIVGLFIGFISVLSAGYFNSIKESANTFFKDNFAVSSETVKEDEAISNDRKLVNNAKNYLEKLKVKFAANPIVNAVLTEMSNYLNDPNSQKELMGIISNKAGGFFNFLGKVCSVITTVLLDILLTIFFFLLFFNKIAEFSYKNKGKGNYIIRSIFNGTWLPKATEDELKEAERIIGELGHKLTIWCRGYLLLVTIDFVIYSIAFYFLNVPYFIALAAVAGLALLLPYIGPIASCTLTVLVTLAIGGDSVSGLQIGGIIAMYLIHNGITEQFILYPMVIGESLGLTALETIIVVLLGGILAGITGMIFALPAASVIKYLIPQIYNTKKISIMRK